ncbi:hypothetical protein M3M35_00585 [Fructilactobacillus myrtifloralis]|uniref:Uncharacterized protein n=1 Tax=Fructilactobacillus myrtifloralis TaxID=2940301 RepID=A0ABY5BQK7_9LACO|nr:hypothetical protein [Fructilactobacillus myrtifloralis]USS85206.1 hypothetical protein M3M35_00585 [Fructilactobacillus myrtifloralis]
MKPMPSWRQGNLTFIATCFLVFVVTIVLYQLQMTNMYIESNQSRVAYYQHQIKITHG